MNPLPEDQDSPLAFARSLGPESEALLSKERVIAAVREKVQAGIPVEDAVLAEVHGKAAEDRQLADEFLAHFLSEFLRLGHSALSPGLRRFLDTGDLVQSVLGDLWPELAGIRFESRGAFLSLLAQKLRWKAMGHARGLRAGRRREDLRAPISLSRLSVSTGGGSPPSLAGDKEEADRFLLALVRLPERDRTILRLHFRGTALAEIGAEVGLAPRSASVALQRAIKRAQALLH
ncbi:MAG: sigma-70 family RNA polymerase sigma factor [Planctomycetota bacterium]